MAGPDGNRSGGRPVLSAHHQIVEAKVIVTERGAEDDSGIVEPGRDQ
jgi:hypothetical protein